MATLEIRGDEKEMHEESHRTAAKACRRQPFSQFVVEVVLGTVSRKLRLEQQAQA